MNAITPIFRAVNWNEVPDQVDSLVWKDQWANQWLPEKIPVAKDIPSWNRMSVAEQTCLTRVFVGLNLLDTMQYETGIPSLNRSATSKHESSVLSLIGTIEAVHAQSYSYAFMTLCSTALINASYEWADTQVYLQKKAAIMSAMYALDDPNRSTIASVFLEGFLFYSGFYYPLYLVSSGRMTNTSDLIKLIIR